MGHVADARSPASHDDSGSYGGDDSEVKTTRLVTGALRRPLHGNEIQSGASSQEAARRLATHRLAARRLAVASRATIGASSSRDGRRNFARPSLDN
jgi:hypothetical protein